MIDTIRKLFQPSTGSEEWPHIKLEAALSAKHIRFDGETIDYGVVCRKKVTTEFVNHLVDMLQGSPGSNFTTYNWHVSGTGSGAESNTDTVATFTNIDDNASSGTQAEGATANIYQTVATIPYTSSKSIQEHGILNANDTASGKLLDRSVFSAINVTDGDSIEFTYELTANAET
jgi:hypothetical protein